VPTPAFKLYEGDPKNTLIVWSRDLNYLLKNLDDGNIYSTELTLGTNQVTASNIDFGTGADQVDASDIPVTDAGGYFVGATVEAVQQEIGGWINYSSGTGALNINSTATVNLILNTTTLLSLSTDGLAVTGAFGCNGASVQTAYTLPAALSTALGTVLSSDLNKTNGVINEIRTALINNGICV